MRTHSAKAPEVEVSIVILITCSLVLGQLVVRRQRWYLRITAVITPVILRSERGTIFL